MTPTYGFGVRLRLYSDCGKVDKRGSSLSWQIPSASAEETAKFVRESSKASVSKPAKYPQICDVTGIKYAKMA